MESLPRLPENILKTIDCGIMGIAAVGLIAGLLSGQFEYVQAAEAGLVWSYCWRKMVPSTIGLLHFGNNVKEVMQKIQEKTPKNIRPTMRFATEIQRFVTHNIFWPTVACLAYNAINVAGK